MCYTNSKILKIKRMKLGIVHPFKLNECSLIVEALNLNFRNWVIENGLKEIRELLHTATYITNLR